MGIRSVSVPTHVTSARSRYPFRLFPVAPQSWSASALMISFTTDSASCRRSSCRLIDPSSKRGILAAAIASSAMLLIAVIAFL